MMMSYDEDSFKKCVPESAIDTTNFGLHFQDVDRMKPMV